MRRTTILLALPLLALAACVNVRAARLGPQNAYEPVPFEQVRVYQLETDVHEQYEKLAILYAEGDADLNNNRQLIDAARKKAGRLGANAIVLSDLREPKFSTRVASVILDVPIQRRAEFLAIRVDGADHEHSR
jgi:hypothetical protein